jgi:hypothetical protein
MPAHFKPAALPPDVLKVSDLPTLTFLLWSYSSNLLETARNPSSPIKIRWYKCHRVIAEDIEYFDGNDIAAGLLIYV